MTRPPAAEPIRQETASHDMVALMDTRILHLHLVSDATGETLSTVVRACLAQFPDVDPRDHIWSLVRTSGQVDRVMAEIDRYPGLVLLTIVDRDLRTRIMAACRDRQMPCINVLEPVLSAFASVLGHEGHGRPGGQHALDSSYFRRIDAMDFTLGHDDGLARGSLDEADVILVGVSRTSKTPTCLYLANRGLRAANVPYVPEVPLPEELFRATRPLIIGLTVDATRLIQVRRTRLRADENPGGMAYVDEEAVRQELATARRLFTSRGWPVIDVSRRSIEETAAAVLQHYHRRRMQVDTEQADA